MSGDICDLVPGQMIQITKGFGFLPVNWTSTKTVYAVDGGSAICTDGTCINCHDAFHGAIRPMSRFVENPELTLKGRKVWNRIFGGDDESELEPSD